MGTWWSWQSRRGKHIRINSGSDLEADLKASFSPSSTDSLHDELEATSPTFELLPYDLSPPSKKRSKFLWTALLVTLIPVAWFGLRGHYIDDNLQSLTTNAYVALFDHSAKPDAFVTDQIDPTTVCVISRMSAEHSLLSEAIQEAGNDHLFPIDSNTALAYARFSWALRHGYSFRVASGRPPLSSHPDWEVLAESPATCEFTVLFEGTSFPMDAGWSLADWLSSIGLRPETDTIVGFSAAEDSGDVVWVAARPIIARADACPDQSASCRDLRNVEPTICSTSVNERSACEGSVLNSGLINDTEDAGGAAIRSLGLAIISTLLTSFDDSKQAAESYAEPLPRSRSQDFSIRDAFRSFFALPEPAVDEEERQRLLAEGDGRSYTPVNPSEVCVLASDSRRLDEPMAPMYDAVPHYSFWTTTTAYQMAWALRHGYQYRRPPAAVMPGYHHNWGKIPTLLDTIKTCKWTVYFDSDAFVADWDWSLDDMRLKWHMHDNASIFQALDPVENPDNHNTTNTGFWIVQQTPVAIKAVTDLLRCPVDIPECARYRHADSFMHDQRAFSDFVRPELREWEDFVVGPCDEANGYFRAPDEDLNCSGRIVSHAWLWKEEIPSLITRLVGQEVIRVLRPVLLHALGI